MQKILFLFFCILFLPAVAFSAWPGDCVLVLFVSDTANYPVQTVPVGQWARGDQLVVDTSAGVISSGSVTTRQSVGSSIRGTLYIVYFDGTTWQRKTSEYYGAWWLDRVSGFAQIDKPGFIVQNLKNEPGFDQCPSNCDIADSDSDGICNECDQSPGQPDQDDCLLTESVDKVTGQLVGVVINRQCDGQSHEFWQSDSYNPVTARSWANIGSSADKLGKQNCQVGLPPGQCCAYSPGSPGETYTASLSPQSAVPATHQQLLDSLLDLPSVDDIPEKCANHNATCKEYCEDKLGVALSYCREDSEGKKVSKCQCSNDFAYEMASPEESTQEKIDQVNNAVNQDSNSNGVPDYADANTQGKTDTDSDGIHDQADVDQTGGMDTNGDGIDDQVTAQAHANAVASSGLSQADSANLDAIEQSTAQTASGVEGLKTGIDAISGNTADLKTKADQAIAESQAIRQHLDDFTAENSDSLSSVEQTLNDGPFSGISPGDIPEDPTSAENFDVDSFVSEFSFAFPDEMKDLIDGSKIETTNSDSCISGTVMGQQIQFCFNQFHAVFVAMGILFQGLCVFRAFGIVVGGFGR